MLDVEIVIPDKDSFHGNDVIFDCAMLSSNITLFALNGEKLNLKIS